MRIHGNNVIKLQKNQWSTIGGVILLKKYNYYALQSEYFFYILVALQRLCLANRGVHANEMRRVPFPAGPWAQLWSAVNSQAPASP